jgi:transcriptional regulator with AAA-type ATPase domain
MAVLLSFISDNEPFVSTEEKAQLGPLLRSLLNLQEAKESVSRVYLFTTPQTEHLVDECKKEISKRHRHISRHTDIETTSLGDISTIRYTELFKILLDEYRHVSSRNTSVIKYVNPYAHDQRIHGCWLTLISSGQINAKLIEITPNGLKSFCPLTTKLGKFRFQDLRNKTATLHESDSILPLLKSIHIVGEHPDFKEAAELTRRFTKLDSHILLTGELNTGRSTLAKLSYLLSARTRFPLEIVDCKTLAATTPLGGKNCCFTSCDRGTLLLLDFDHLAKNQQYSLCEFIESRHSKTSAPNSAKLRILATAGSDLESKIQSGDFADSLFYLFPSTVKLPPLRSRKSDIPLLVEHLLNDWNQLHCKQLTITDEALEHLSNRNWEGNISELKHTLMQSIQNTKGDVIGESSLSFSPRLICEIPPFDRNFNLSNELDRVRTKIISQALKQTGGIKSNAAKLLGVTPQALSSFKMVDGNSVDGR